MGWSISDAAVGLQARALVAEAAENGLIHPELILTNAVRSARPYGYAWHDHMAPHQSTLTPHVHPSILLRFFALPLAQLSSLIFGSSRNVIPFKGKHTCPCIP
jgi:hypothetical protein